MRLAQGGRVDRAKPLRFSFDDRAMTGFAGDTLASALLANNVHLVGRSFKYHRPRGFLGAGVDEPNALVGVDRGEGRWDPNQRATVVPLYEGLRVESQNRWPSLGFDIGAINDLAAPLIPAGFYYKTFMYPRKAWHALYEPVIRRAAGLGRAPDRPDPDRYAQSWAHCELLIVGAGPAGLACALAAARRGERVVLCDEQEEMGGSLLSRPEALIDGKPAWDWLAGALTVLAAHSKVTLLPRTTAFGYGQNNLLALAERLTDHLSRGEAEGARERRWLVRAGQVVLATGAHERPIVFANNDRPGIMLAGAGATWLTRYGVLPGNRVVACAEDASGYAVAARFAEAGAAVTVIDPNGGAEGTLPRGVELLTGFAPVDARGGKRVSALVVERAGERRALSCDLVLMAGGWTPSLHLFSQSRGKVVWSEEAQAFLPGGAAQAQVSVGGCRGSFGLADCLAEGWRAGQGEGAAPSAAADPRPAARPIESREHDGRAFVDFQNDVTAKDIRLAVREGFRSIEHIKRYTTTGMATDQGRTSNLNALAIAAKTLDLPIPSIGLTTFRAPYTPTTFGTFAGATRGALFDPARTTPTHDGATARGAVFEDVGQWKRARYFPQGGEDMHAAVDRECLAVRNAAGIFDASTLGKIEVVGPDAAEFLNRTYVNAFLKLGVHKCRYGLLLREDGFILDDGVIGRIAPDRFHVTTTTGGSANVLHMMEDYRQTEFPELKVWLTSTTEQFATIAVQGPRARDIVSPLVEGIDMSPEAFPHMSLRIGRIAGVETRLWRVSFTGELGYEINVPSSHGQAVWNALCERGAPLGLTPYGTETMHVLRAEKGYIIVGQETDGTVTPDDAGMGGMIGKAKPDFIGKRSLARVAMTAPDRKQLVGLVSADGRTVLEEGAQLINPAGDRARSIGHVSSAYWSAALDKPIALALVRGGRARMGSRIEVAMPGGNSAVDVVESVFYDRQGARLDA